MLPRREEGLTQDFGHPDDIHGIERKVLCQNLMTERDDDDVRDSDDGGLVYVKLSLHNQTTITHTNKQTHISSTKYTI